MSNDINLLVRNNKKLLKEQSNLKSFRLISIGFLVFLLFISALVLILNQQLSSNSVEKDRESMLSEMLPFRENEAKLNVVNNRIENISNVLGIRVDVHKIIDAILEKVPEGLSVESLEFTEKKITIKVSSTSLIPVDGFINNLVEMAERKEMIKALVLESLDIFELAGNYNVSIEIGI